MLYIGNTVKVDRFVLLSRCIQVGHLMRQLRPNVSIEESIMVDYQGSQHGVIHDLMLHDSQLCHDLTVLKCNKTRAYLGSFCINGDGILD
jgi:hypothetical protein